MTLIQSPELVGLHEVGGLLAKIEDYIKDAHGKTFYESVLKHLNIGDPAVWKQKVIKVMIDSLGIWLPDEYYERLPIIRPYVIRDPKCRTKVEGHAHDEWSAPDDRGYLRDDNSLITWIPATHNHDCGIAA